MDGNGPGDGGGGPGGQEPGGNNNGPQRPSDKWLTFQGRFEREMSNFGSESQYVGSDFDDRSVSISLVEYTEDRLPPTLRASLAFKEAAIISGYDKPMETVNHYYSNSDVSSDHDEVESSIGEIGEQYRAHKHPTDSAYNAEVAKMCVHNQATKIHNNVNNYTNSLKSFIDRSEATPDEKSYLKHRVDMIGLSLEKRQFTE